MCLSASRINLDSRNQFRLKNQFQLLYTTNLKYWVSEIIRFVLRKFETNIHYDYENNLWFIIKIIYVLYNGK